MIDLSELILHIENILTDNECDDLIDLINDRNTVFIQETCLEANISKVVTSSVDISYMIPRTKLFNLVNKKTNEAISLYEKHLTQFDAFFVSQLIKNFKYSHAYRLMKYTSGQNIHQHIDKGPDTFGSCTLNLNDDYKGGEFTFFKGQYQKKLKKGDALIFPASEFFVHGVNEVLNGVRYSVNSFLGNESAVLDKKNVDSYLHESCIKHDKKIELAVNFEDNLKMGDSIYNPNINQFSYLL